MTELPVCCLCYETLGRYGGPVTLPCGHNGCLQCIASLQSRQSEPLCPLCRVPFNAAQPLVCNHELRDLVTLASSMFIEHSDGWSAFPSATVAAGHALHELKKGQLDKPQQVGLAPTSTGNTGALITKDGLEVHPSAPLDALDGDWTDVNHDDSAAGQAVHRGLLELESPKWLPDSYASSCGGCRLAFQPFLRLRHHCRMCGKIFCHSCCHELLLLPPKYNSREPQRVCEPCATLLQPLQPFLAGILSNAVQPPVHDAVDSISVRSWFNSPWSASLGEDIFKAANILQTFSTVGQLHPERGVPAAVLQGARGLVLLSALRVGAGWSCTLGTGLMVARNASDNGWSAPCAVGWCGLGWGLQLGGELVDLLLVLRTDAAVEALCSHLHLGVGGSIGAAVGPIGRHADATMTVGTDGGRTAIYSYSVSRGAFLGISVEGTVLAARPAINLDFYGYATTPRQLLLDGTTPAPPGACILYDALHALADKLAPQQQQQASLTTAATTAAAMTERSATAAAAPSATAILPPALAADVVATPAAVAAVPAATVRSILAQQAIVGLAIGLDGCPKQVQVPPLQHDLRSPLESRAIAITSVDATSVARAAPSNLYPVVSSEEVLPSPPSHRMAVRAEPYCEPRRSSLYPPVFQHSPVVESSIDVDEEAEEYGLGVMFG